MAVTRTRGPLNRDQSNAEIMRALLLCRNTDIAMRRHIRAETGMGDTDILAVDYLRDQHSQHQPVGPKQLASHLGLSSPSTTVLLDRLEKLGSVERMPHPTDRRALTIEARDIAPSATPSREAAEVRIQRLIEQLSVDDAAVVLTFLTSLVDAARPDAG